MIVIDGKAVAITYDFVVGYSNNKPPITLSQEGLAGTETVDLQISNDGGASYKDVSELGVQAQLTVDNTALTVLAPGRYRLNKGVTAGAVTVSLSTMSSS